MSGKERWVIIEDEALARGFTQIPNAITRNPKLSMQAKFLYGLLLSYAWQDPDSYPGLARLREDTGAKEDTIRKYIQELVKAGLLEVVRRGMGKTNRYVFKSLNKVTNHPLKGGITADNHPSNGGIMNTPIGVDHEHPHTVGSGSPLLGGPTNTQSNEYTENEDSVSTSTEEDSLQSSSSVPESGKTEVKTSVRKEKSPEDHTGKLMDDLEEIGVYLDREQVRAYAGNFGKLKNKALPHSEIVRARQRIVAEWPRIQLSPQQAHSDLSRERSSEDEREEAERRRRGRGGAAIRIDPEGIKNPAEYYAGRI